MEKKEYIAPQVRVRNISAPKLLQASVGVGGGDTSGNFAKPFNEFNNLIDLGDGNQY